MDIVIYTRGLAFDGDSAEKALGGSETAVINMARELARLGNRVRVFCSCPNPGEYEGVEYADLAAFQHFATWERCDVFICSRFVDGLSAPVQSKVNVLWNHDVLVDRAAPIIHSLMYKIDALFCLSQFQLDQYQKELRIPSDRFVLTRNGVDLALIDEAVVGVRRDPNRLIYTSRPERGLAELLAIWPTLKEQRPELTLGIAWYDNPNADAEMQRFISNLKSEITNLEDVELLGSLSKRDLYREMARARLWVYPSTFPEVSCISAIEAAACGTPAVASRYCALKETITGGESGLLIAGTPGSQEYTEAFIDATLTLLEDERLWRRMSEAGCARVEELYQWSDIAKEWSDWLGLKVAMVSDGRSKLLPNEIAFRAHGRSKLLPNGQRQTVSCCMIVKNAEGTLHRCLKSVQPWVDEIIICDTGSGDSTIDIAYQYTDNVRKIEWHDDFGAARNQSIEDAKGDWILWIDADEYLVGGEQLEKYLRDNMYNGYVIQQHHQALDAEFKPDVPVRLFRNQRSVCFYGVIHEHPEEALNAGISPTVVLSDVHIIHDGYITEQVRRERFLRNLPMLLKDREKYPERRLGLVFLARDYIHLARYEAEKIGAMTDRGRRFLEKAAAIHREHFNDPNNPLHAYSFPLYQTALALLGEGVEVTWYLAPSHAKGESPQRCRFVDEAELKGLLEQRMQGMFRTPETQFAFE